MWHLITCVVIQWWILMRWYKLWLVVDNDNHINVRILLPPIRPSRPLLDKVIYQEHLTTITRRMLIMMKMLMLMMTLMHHHNPSQNWILKSIFCRLCPWIPDLYPSPQKINNKIFPYMKHNFLNCEYLVGVRVRYLGRIPFRNIFCTAFLLLQNFILNIFL